MLNIGRGWLVSVTMLNIRRERRREHPMDTSEGVTTGVAQLPKRNPKRSNDLRSHPVAMLLLRKKRGKKPVMRRTYFRSGPLPVKRLHEGGYCATSGCACAEHTSGHVTHVISGHVTHVTSGHVTSGNAQWSDPPHDPPQMITELCPYTTHIPVLSSSLLYQILVIYSVLYF